MSPRCFKAPFAQSFRNDIQNLKRSLSCLPKEERGIGTKCSHTNATIHNRSYLSHHTLHISHCEKICKMTTLSQPHHTINICHPHSELRQNISCWFIMKLYFIKTGITSSALFPTIEALFKVSLQSFAADVLSSPRSVLSISIMLGRKWVKQSEAVY